MRYDDDTIMNWFRYIGGVMFSVLASNEVDRVFELWSGQTKDYTIGISWFAIVHLFNGKNKFSMRYDEVRFVLDQHTFFL
jgi:hypothetical protein